MRAIRLRLWVWSALAALGGVLVVGPGLARSSGAGSTGVAYSIQLQATIDPATEKWVGSALDDAADQGAEVAIIRLDTPGGLRTVHAPDPPART